MAFRNRSSMRGRKPAWFKAASDIRFVGHEGDDQTDLLFEVPTFAESAEELYRQQELWPTKPAESDTGFEVFGDVLDDVSVDNRDSDRFDRPLLKHIVELRPLFDGELFREIEVGSERRRGGLLPRINPAVIGNAKNFYRTTPGPRRIKLYGTLDMIRASTQSFGLKLQNAEEAPGVLVGGDVCDLQGLLNQPVTVYGEAVYRPSGKLLRIDADEIVPATERDQFFSKVPHGIPKSNIQRTIRDQAHKRGIAAIIGKWPGDETEDQIQEALRRLS